MKMKYISLLIVGAIIVAAGMYGCLEFGIIVALLSLLALIPHFKAI